MSASAERLEFERAASFRDKLARLESLRAQFERHRFAVESLSFLYEVPGVGGDDRVYLVRRGRVRGEVPAPRSPAERQSLAELAAQVFRGRELKGARVPAHEIDELLLLSSWFRTHPKELERTRQA
jgi:excinuclease UvrABC nuclease subunit